MLHGPSYLTRPRLPLEYHFQFLGGNISCVIWSEMFAWYSIASHMTNTDAQDYHMLSEMDKLSQSIYWCNVIYYQCLVAQKISAASFSLKYIPCVAIILLS